MRFAFNEEQEALRDSARRFLADRASSQQTRAAMKLPQGYDPAVWRAIGEELGWTAVVIPEEYGGFGFTYVELVALMEEMGAALVCAPFLSSICLGANALLIGGTEAQRRAHLPGIASGETVATVALAEAGAGWEVGAPLSCRAQREGEDVVISGVKRYVPDGCAASLLLVAAQEEGGRTGLYILSPDAEGLTREALNTMDETRPQAQLTLSGVRVPRAARLGGEEADTEAILASTMERACIALAAEQVGLAQRCLDMSVEYAKVRVQFGRPIGSFQAVKHMCADMMLMVESARSAAYFAGWAAAHSPEEVTEAAAVAKAYCSEAAFHCASQNIQIHGGIGFSWEHDAHLYFKRARSSELLFGDPAAHKETLARQLGLQL